MLDFGDRVERGLNQPRLADAGLTDQEHRLPLAVRSLPPPLEHERKLLVAPDHRRRPPRLAGLEAAAGRSLAENLEAAHGATEAFEPGRPELAQLEQLAQQPACVVRDHRGAGLGHLLQPRRQVGGFADHGLLLCRSLAHEIADHDQARRDADPRRQRLARRLAEQGDSMGNREAGTDRALGLVFMRPRPAEIGEHAIAHELGDVALEARDLARHRVLIRADHLAHVFRIELRRQRGRADEVDEHHRQLTAFRNTNRLYGSSSAILSCSRNCRVLAEQGRSQQGAFFDGREPRPRVP